MHANQRRLQKILDEARRPSRAQLVADALAEGYRRAHPEADPEAPTAADVEQAGAEALRRAMYGESPADDEKGTPSP